MAARFTVADPIGTTPFDRAHWQGLVEMGVLAEKGIGPVEEMVVAEELGRSSAYP